MRVRLSGVGCRGDSLGLYFMELSSTWLLYSSFSSCCFLWIFAGLDSEDLGSDQESELRDSQTSVRSTSTDPGFNEEYRCAPANSDRAAARP